MAAIAKANRDRAYLIDIMTRSGCHPCDVSEAGRQLASLSRKKMSLERQMNLYGE